MFNSTFATTVGVGEIIRVLPLFAAVLGWLFAQLLKPFVHKLKGNKFDWKIIKASGGFPSSHSAMVSALAFSVGFNADGHFMSIEFAIAMTFAFIVSYDAFNVRWYSGQSIKVTKELVNELDQKGIIDNDKPEYNVKLKEVLGHKLIEIIAGWALGFAIAVAQFYIFVNK